MDFNIVICASSSVSNIPKTTAVPSYKLVNNLDGTHGANVSSPLGSIKILLVITISLVYLS